MKKYVQVPSVSEQVAGRFSPVAIYDGIAEIWLGRMEDIPKVVESSSVKTIIAQDEAKFIDRQNIR